MERIRIYVIYLAHMVNDNFMNFLPSLLPVLLPARHFTVEQGAVLISVFGAVYALSEPAMGYLVDNLAQRWPIFVGTAWLGTILSLTGLVPQYGLLLVMVGLAALGTAAFHPQGTHIVFGLSPSNRRGLTMSIFLAMGNIGWVIAPLAVIPWLKTHGLTGTIFFVFPALATGALLYFLIPRHLLREHRKVVPFAVLGQAVREKVRPLSYLVGVVVTRSLVRMSFVALVPLYLVQHGTPVIVAGQYLSVMLFAGMVGGLFGGHFSDRFGRRLIAVVTHFLAAPFFLLFLHTSGLVSLLFLALAGFFLMASMSVAVTAAQEVLPKNAALAGGLMLSLGAGVGGLGLVIIGALAQAYGLAAALQYAALLAVVAAALSLGIPGRLIPLPQRKEKELGV
jgi:FSR family fosmidomycin resistance protein-like MFS transporter